MKKLASAVGLLLALSGPGFTATPPATTPEAARAQIQQVIGRFQAALLAHDKVALNALFVPEGGSWFEVLGEDAYRRIKARKPDLSRVHADSHQHFAALMAASKQRMEEKFSNVRIQSDGAVASVYFDFVFLIDGKRNNAGAETWQLVNTGDGWKISAMAYSTYPALPPLK